MNLRKSVFMAFKHWMKCTAFHWYNMDYINFECEISDYSHRHSIVEDINNRFFLSRNHGPTSSLGENKLAETCMIASPLVDICGFVDQECGDSDGTEDSVATTIPAASNAATRCFCSEAVYHADCRICSSDLKRGEEFRFKKWTDILDPCFDQFPLEDCPAPTANMLLQVTRFS